MKATHFLEAQNRVVQKLFKKLRGADAEHKGAIFEELAACIMAQGLIEREIFYPACEKQLGPSHLLGAALVDLDLIAFSVFQACKAGGDATFGVKVSVLEEVIEHHVEEGEDKLIPQFEKAAGKALLRELGKTMQARFAEAKAVDFRRPLHEHLMHVLAGAIEPAAPGAAASD